MRKKDDFMELTSFAIASLLCIFPFSMMDGAEASWNVDANGSWNDNANWNPTTFPNGMDDVADFFGSSITTGRTITLGGPITIGTINFEDSSNGYLITSDVLTFQVSSGNATINVTNTQGKGPPIIASAINLSSNLTITQPFSNAGPNLKGAIFGTGGLTKLGTGPVYLTGINTYSGGTTVTDGSLIGNTKSLQGDIINNSNVHFRQMEDGTYAGKISGSGDVHIFLPNISTLTLTNTNSYTGTTAVYGGTLKLSGSGSLSKESSLYLPTGSTFDITAIGDSETTIGILTGGGTINIAGKTLKIEVDEYQGMSFPGSITGSGGSLIKQGLGVLLVTGANYTYNGGTTVNGGTLQISGSLPSAAITINAATLKLSASGSLSATSTLNLANAASIFDISTANSGRTIGDLVGAPADSSVILGSNALTFGTSANTTFAGIISGSGSLIKNGSGTVILTGANTYSGGITVSAGALQGNTTSLQGNMTNNASVVFDQAALGTYAGAISGTGSITKQNTGTLILTGANIYSGGTTVSAGILQGNSSSLQDNMTNNASVVFDQTASGTYAGIISGTGAITKQNTGTLILTGANTYSGGTTVSAGILQGNTTSLRGNMTNNASVVFDQTAAGTYAGSMNGTGSLVKQGAESLTLSNTNSITGAVTVSAGTLSVNGTLAGGSSMTVDAGATLKGSGTITKNATISGTLAPGNSIGTIFLIGAQTLTAGSKLEIEFDPASSDLVDITGTLAIQSGASLQIVPMPGQYTLPTTYTIINTTGGITGSFSSVTSSLPLFEFHIEQTFSDLLLVLENSSIASLIHTGNAGVVAKCLDKLSNRPCSRISSVISALRQIPDEKELKEALLQLQPSAFTSLAVAQENNVLYIKNAIYNRLDEQPHGCRTGRQKNKPSNPINGYFKRKRDDKSEQPAKDKTLNLWVSAIGAHTSQHSSQGEPGFIANSPGVFMGIDSKMGKRSCLGGGFGYTHTHLNWRQSRGLANMQTTYAALYGQWNTPFAFIQSSMTGGYNVYSVNREIDFGHTSRIKETAKSFHNGMEGSFHFKSGLKFKSQRGSLVPFVSVDYIVLHENCFKERGARALNLKIKSKDSDLLSTEVGLDVSACFHTSHISYTPFLRLSGIRESRFQGNKEQASFNCGCAMTVKGLYPSRTLSGVTAGFSASLYADNDLSFFYQGKFGKHYNDNSCYLQYLRRF